MLARMSKVYIFGPREDLSSFLSYIHNFGSMQIEPPPPAALMSTIRAEEPSLDSKLLKEKKDLEDIMEKLNKVLLLFPEKQKKGGGGDFWYLTSELSTPQLLEAIDYVYNHLSQLFSRSQSIKNDLKLLSKYRKVIDAVHPLLQDTPGMEHMDMIGLLLETSIEEVVAALHGELKKLTGGDYRIFTNPVEGGAVAAIIAFPQRYSPHISKMLWEENISELKLPTDLQNIPLKEALEAIFMRQTNLPDELHKVETEISTLFETWEYKSQQWSYPLWDIRQAIEDRLREINMINRFILTKYSFIVGGWVPSKEIDHLRKDLQENFEGKIMMQTVRIASGEHDRIPVKKENPKILQPFQVFMDLLPPPKYGTIDPTPFFAVFFPIFFGMILGDMGYGIILLLLSLFLRKKYANKPFVRQLGSAFLICSFFTMLFGFIYGEFLGDLGEHLFGMHPFVNRMEAVIPFLILSIVIGFFHITLGVVLGIINSFNRGKKKHFYYKLAELGCLITIVLLVGSYSGILSASLSTPLIIALMALLTVTIITEGFIAPLEIIKDLGNILSYTRLMAIGLSSVILAFVANKLGQVPQTLAVGIIIASLVHLIAIVIGIFSPTIHSMRLHFVEFFGKFFEPGGRPYQPFKKGE